MQSIWKYNYFNHNSSENKIKVAKRKFKKFDKENKKI